MPGLYFEDLTEGRVIDAEWRRTVTEADNVLFCGMTMNVARLHLDAEYMKGTECGRPLVNSLFTLGLMIGMSVHNTTVGTTIANLGMTDDRGRDGHCWPPPAQIRTGPIQASGSYLGWLAKNRSCGQG